MGATSFEYRFRYAIHGIIYGIGFFAPWSFYLNQKREYTWKALMDLITQQGWLGVAAAATLLLAISILFAGLGAFLRVWGSAYVGSSVVHSSSMHGQTLLADGPYRRTRNPLYLGTLLHTFAVALIMPVTGAIFAIVLLWIFQIRLALAEEPFLTARFGEAYGEYEKRVPRFIPAITPRVPSAGSQPRWLQAALGEIYMVGVFVTLAAFGWSFNVNTLIRGVLISLGISLIVRALLPKPTPVEATI